MSTDARAAWRDQQALINQRLSGFLTDPGQPQLDAVLAELRSYAQAASAGILEIPQRWISVG